MEEGRRNFMVGAFVLVGLGALGALIVMFGRGPTWLVRGSTYPIRVHFDQVAGIRTGTQVTVKGIEVGRVDGVDLLSVVERPRRPGEPPGAMLVARDAGVEVRLAVKSRFLIPKGSTAQTTEPMLGQGRPPIEIVPGPSDAEPLGPGAVIEGKIRRALDSVLPPGLVNTLETTARQVGDAAEAMTPVLDEAKALLERRAPREVDQPGGPQGNLSSAVARLDASLRHFNDVLGDGQVKSQLRETVANVHEMSEKGKKVMSDLETAASDVREIGGDARKLLAKADETLGRWDSHVDTLARTTLGTLDRTDRFLDHLNTVGQQISTGQGNLGRLVMDNKLYEALVLTAERLSLAVEEFRALVAEWREGKVRVAL